MQSLTVRFLLSALCSGILFIVIFIVGTILFGLPSPNDAKMLLLGFGIVTLTLFAVGDN